MSGISVDVFAGAHVVEAVEDERELLEEGEAEVRGLDVAVVRTDVDLLVEGRDDLLGHEGLGLAYVGFSEQELPVQIRHVDRVEVHNSTRSEDGGGSWCPPTRYSRSHSTRGSLAVRIQCLRLPQPRYAPVGLW
jgi:hypothetical protein